ncbi:MAG: hypothetical protein WC582_05260 [Patescibacteria group bacterium]
MTEEEKTVPGFAGSAQKQTGQTTEGTDSPKSTESGRQSLSSSSGFSAPGNRGAATSVWPR